MDGRRLSRALVPYSARTSSGSRSGSIPPSDISIGSDPGALVDISFVSGEAITSTEHSAVRSPRALELAAFPLPPKKAAADSHLHVRPQGYITRGPDSHGSYSEGLKDVHREDNGTTDEFYKRLRARINGPLGDRSLGPSTVSDTTEVELPVGFDTQFRMPVAVRHEQEAAPPTHIETIEEQYHAPLVDAPNEKRRPMASPNTRKIIKIVIGVLAILAFIAAVAVGSYYLIKPKERALSLQESDVSIGSINITNPMMEEFQLSIMLHVQKQTNITGGMGSMKCELYGVEDSHNDYGTLRKPNELKQAFIGKVETDRLMMKEGTDLMIEASTSTIDPGNTNWVNLVEAVFAGNMDYMLQVNAAGRYLTKSVTWALGFRKMLPVVGSIEKAQGLFPNYYGMGDFYLLPRSGVYDIEASILNGTFPYKARTVFTNPSNLTTFLGDASLFLLMDGEIIGQHVIPNLTVVPDDNFVPFLTGNLNGKVFRDSYVFSRFLQATLCWTCLNPGRLTVEGIAAHIDGVEIPYLSQGMKAVNRSAALIARSDIVDKQLSQINGLTIKGAKFSRTSLAQNITLEDGFMEWSVKLPLNREWSPADVRGYSMSLQFLLKDNAQVPMASLNISSIAGVKGTWSSTYFQILNNDGYTEFTFTHPLNGDSINVVGDEYFMDEGITNLAGNSLSTNTVQVNGYLSIDIETQYANGTLEAMKITPRSMQMESQWLRTAGVLTPPVNNVQPPPAQVGEEPIRSPIGNTRPAPAAPTSTTVRTTRTTTTTLQEVLTGFIKPTIMPGLGSVLKVVEEKDGRKGKK